MADFKSSVAEVKLAYDIVDYIQMSGINLKPNGANRFKGLCGFHNEKTPSFSVNQHFQNYRCFGCGASGDLIKFVQEFENLEFFDALKKLAEEKGIKLDIKEERSGIDYSSLRECMRTISNFFYVEYKKLESDHPAKKEVKSRGLEKTNVVYGYAPEGRQVLYRHLRSKNFSDETILLTGACIQFEGKKEIFDFWHGRLMFFITDITGKAIGWSGRKLYDSDSRGKYVNSRDGVLFDKSESLFNVSNAKKKAAETKTVYVTEGQFDVAAFDHASLENSVASSGTAFTEKQAMILRRLVTEEGKIVFCFDGDKAGRAAAEKVFINVPIIHSQAYVVSFPEGQDPCDYRLDNGDEGLTSYVINSQIPLVEFVIDETGKGFDLTNDVEKTKYVEATAKVLKTVSSNVLREAYTKKVSLDSFVSIDVVRQAVQDANSLSSDQLRSNVKVEAGEPVTEKVLTSEEKTLEEIQELIKDDELYGVTARLLSLALSESTLVDTMFPLIPRLPDTFANVATELNEMGSDKPIIAEMFSQSSLVELLITWDFFPFSHLMNGESKEQQFAYLSSKMEMIERTRKENYVRSKVATVLKNSPDQGAAFLKKALEAEARGMGEH